MNDEQNCGAYDNEYTKVWIQENAMRKYGNATNESECDVTEYDGYVMPPPVEPTPENMRLREESMRCFKEESAMRMQSNTKAESSTNDFDVCEYDGYKIEFETDPEKIIQRKEAAARISEKLINEFDEKYGKNKNR